MPRTPYAMSRYTEAQMFEIDEAGERATTPTGPTLIDFAKQPDTIKQLAHAHAQVLPRRWCELASSSGFSTSTKPTPAEEELIREVWNTLPGSTCMFDAIRLIARTA